MPSPENVEVRAMWEALAELGPKADGTQPTVEDFREAYEVHCARVDVPSHAAFTQVQIGGVSAIETQVAGQTPRSTILYLHGGGFALGSPGGYRSFAVYLSEAADARVVLPDYGLAPEHPFPAAIEDAIAAYNALLEQGVPSSRIAVVGDSAGGGLALGMLLALKDAGLPLPAVGVLISPWTDLLATGESVNSRAERDPAVSRDSLAMLAELYAPGENLTHPHASPHYGDFAGLPPLLVLVGTEEILWDDANRFVEQASKAGVSATLEVGEGMYHVWPCYAAILPEGAQATMRIGAFIKSRINANSEASSSGVTLP